MEKKIWLLKIWWLIRASIEEIGNILLLISISYLSILINVFIIYGMKDKGIVEILQRQDILNVILTAGISVLAGVLILELGKDRERLRKLIIIPILFTCLVALVISNILTVQIELKATFFNTDLIYSFTLFCFITTLLLIFFSNYDVNRVKEYISIQKSANESRKVEKVKVDNKEYKI